MERARFIDHQGTPILFVDFSGITDAETLRLEADRASALAQRQPPGSLLILVNLEGVPYSLESVRILRGAVLRNEPYVRARAVAGLPELGRLSFRALAHLSRRRMESFRTLEEAKAWLAEQE